MLFAMGLAHMIGHIQGIRAISNPPDDKTRILFQTMDGYTLPDFPVERSMLSLYSGFSITFSACALLIAALVLISVSGMKEDASALRRLARVYLAGLLALTAISLNYFIWPPSVFLLVSFGLAAFGLARIRKAA